MSLQTWKQLCKLVEGSDIALTHYKDDLYKHDRTILEGYDDSFCYAWRKCGTDLVRMWPDVEQISWKGNYASLDELKKILVEDFLQIDYGVSSGDRNKRFLYFDGKAFHFKTCDDLRKIYMTHVDIIITRAKHKEVNYVF